MSSPEGRGTIVPRRLSSATSSEKSREKEKEPDFSVNVASPQGGANLPVPAWGERGEVNQAQSPKP